MLNYCWCLTVCTFLAHLSTKCSGWAIVTGLCPSSSVVRRASCVVRKLFYLNIFSSETTHWIWTKLYRNDPWLVPYQSCSNGSDWLHKYVTGSKSRFSKCNFQKSCLKLQGPELSYLVYSIIQRSSTKVVQIMPLGSKLTPPRGSQFYIELYMEKFKRHLLLNRLW